MKLHWQKSAKLASLSHQRSKRPGLSDSNEVGSGKDLYSRGAEYEAFIIIEKHDELVFQTLSALFVVFSPKRYLLVDTLTAVLAGVALSVFHQRMSSIGC